MYLLFTFDRGTVGGRSVEVDAAGLVGALFFGAAGGHRALFWGAVGGHGGNPVW